MKIKKPNLKKCNLSRLWWENEKGDNFIPTQNQVRECFMPDPVLWPYALSRFPLAVETSCYKRRKKDGGYGGKDMMFRYSSGANGSLALALCRKLDPKMKNPHMLENALIIASTACERCMNILAHQCGLSWGYSHKSDAAKKAGTSCDLCK